MKADQLIKEANPEHQIAALRKQNALLQSKIGRLETVIGSQKEIRDAIRFAVEAAEPLPIIHWKEPHKADSKISVVLELSDWQTGEKINPDETEGISAYSWAIEKRRVNGLMDNVLKWVHTQRHAYRIDTLNIFGISDWVSGNIHKELEVTNEFPVPVAAVNCGQLLGHVLRTVAPHFHEVYFDGVPLDNHGRFDKKPQMKQGALNSWSYVVHEVARAYTREIGNLEFREAQGMKHLVKVAGFNFLLEHGHTIKGWQGFPYYGMGRMKGKESMRRMKLEREEYRKHKGGLKREYGFDYYNTAHFHVPFFIEGDHLGNGCLTGTTEYDHAEGRYAKPCQISFLVHPKHGLFNLVPFWC